MTKKITLIIKGMNCASCAVHIENHLKSYPGLITVTVNFAASKAFIKDP